MRAQTVHQFLRNRSKEIRHKSTSKMKLTFNQIEILREEIILAKCSDYYVL